MQSKSQLNNGWGKKKINQQRQTGSDTDDRMVKYIRTAIINVLQMFRKKKKMEESMSLLRKSMEDIKKTQMELLKLKYCI